MSEHDEAREREVLNEVDRDEGSAILKEMATDGSRTPFEDVSAKQSAAVAGMVAAGSYGYLSATYPAGNYPETAWVYILFGTSLGVALTAAIMSDLGGDDE